MEPIPIGKIIGLPRLSLQRSHGSSSASAPRGSEDGTHERNLASPDERKQNLKSFYDVEIELGSGAPENLADCSFPRKPGPEALDRLNRPRDTTTVVSTVRRHPPPVAQRAVFLGAAPTSSMALVSRACLCYLLRWLPSATLSRRIIILV